MSNFEYFCKQKNSEMTNETIACTGNTRNNAPSDPSHIRLPEYESIRVQKHYY